jgi:hypothetical protein
MSDRIAAVVQLAPALARCQSAWVSARKANYRFAIACRDAQAAGHSVREIASAAGVGKDTVSRAIRAVDGCASEDEFNIGYADVVKRTNGSQGPSALPTPPDAVAPVRQDEPESRVQRIIDLEAEADRLEAAAASRRAWEAAHPPCPSCRERGTHSYSCQTSPRELSKNASELREAIEDLVTEKYGSNVDLSTADDTGWLADVLAELAGMYEDRSYELEDEAA